MKQLPRSHFKISYYNFVKCFWKQLIENLTGLWRETAYLLGHHRPVSGSPTLGGALHLPACLSQ